MRNRPLSPEAYGRTLLIGGVLVVAGLLGIDWRLAACVSGCGLMYLGWRGLNVR